MVESDSNLLLGESPKPPSATFPGAKEQLKSRRVEVYGRRLSLYSQALTKSELVHKVAETYATQVLLIVIGLVTSVATARTLGPEGRGLYAVAMSIGVIGVQLGNLGLQASNTFYLAKDRMLLPTLLGNSLLVSFGLGGALALIAGLFLWIRPNLAPLQGVLLVQGLGWIPLGLCFLLLENLLLALQDVRSYNTVEVLNRLLSLAFVGALILRGGLTAVGVFSCMMATLVLSSAWCLVRLLHTAQLVPRCSLTLIRMHLRLGVKAYLVALFGYLLLRLDLVMVKYLLGAEQAGYYSIASTMADYILMLPSVIAMILFPRLSGLESTGEKYRQSTAVVKGTAVILAPLIVVAGIAAKPVVRLLFGTPFLPAVDPFLWLLPGVFTLGVETAMVQFLNSIGFPVEVVLVWLFSTALNVGVNFWTIPHLGLKGASIASSVCYSLVFLFVLLLSRRTMRAAG